MQLPKPLLDSLQTIPAFDKKAFEKVHASGEQVTSVRINPGKPPMVNEVLSIGHHTHASTLLTPIPW
ncbi:MAG: hypothetical protein ABI688_04770, partial [Bacteroidota bacterium]